MNIDQAHDFMNAATCETSSDDDDMHCENLNGGGGEADLTVCRAIFAGIWLAFFQEGQQQSCEQVGLITGDGKAKIFGEAVCEVRILPPVSPFDDTWIVHTSNFAG